MACIPACINRLDSVSSHEDRDRPELGDDTDSTSDASSTQYYECNLCGEFKDSRETDSADIFPVGSYLKASQPRYHSGDGDSSSLTNPAVILRNEADHIGNRHGVSEARTIYHSATADDSKADTSSAYSSIIQDISSLEGEHQSMSYINVVPSSDEFDELIILSQDKINDGNCLSDIMPENIHQGMLFQVRSAGKHSSFSSGSTYDEYVQVNRKPHEKLPYEQDHDINTEEASGGICRVVLALDDLDTL